MLEEDIMLAQHCWVSGGFKVDILPSPCALGWCDSRFLMVSVWL